jgi:hypothetical protein
MSVQELSNLVTIAVVGDDLLIGSDIPGLNRQTLKAWESIHEELGLRLTINVPEWNRLTFAGARPIKAWRGVDGFGGAVVRVRCVVALPQLERWMTKNGFVTKDFEQPMQFLGQFARNWMPLLGEAPIYRKYIEKYLTIGELPHKRIKNADDLLQHKLMTTERIFFDNGNGDRSNGEVQMAISCKIPVANVALIEGVLDEVVRLPAFVECAHLVNYDEDFASV